MPAPAARSEMESGRDALEAIIGGKVGLFAYPNGKPGQDYLPEQAAIVRELGFEVAVSTQPGSSHHRDAFFLGGPHHFLDRGGAERRQGERDAHGLRCARRQDLAVRMLHAGQADRRDGNGHGHFLAHHPGAGAAVRLVRTRRCPQPRPRSRRGTADRAAGRVVAGALEGEVLHEVRDAGVGGRLQARPGQHVRGDGDGSRAREAGEDDARPRGQLGALEHCGGW